MPSDLSVVHGAPHWRVVDFISDLHLQPSEPQNFSAWQAYMQRTQADAIFILGDLFEVWVGDDALGEVQGVAPSLRPSFESECATVLKLASERVPLYLMHGNRDFLIGEEFCTSAGSVMLQDPCLLMLAGEPWVLSHGDALCTGDSDYQQFRGTVRSPEWQSDFLNKPLVQRREVARGLRVQSQARKLMAHDLVDVDPRAVVELLEKAHSNHLIHGHTHLPGDHTVSPGLYRHVLSDWDAGAVPPRAEVLRLTLRAGLPGTDSARISPLVA